MRHRKRGRKLNRTSSHKKALMRNLAISMITHKRIKTTDAKAKELRSFVERLVTYAKKGDLHNRRLIQKKLPGKLGREIANTLIHDIAPDYTDRNGGYTRIILHIQKLSFLLKLVFLLEMEEYQKKKTIH